MNGMQLLMTIISKDRIVRNSTIQGLKDSNSQPFATQSKKGDELVFLMLAMMKSFDLMGNQIVDLSLENQLFENKKGFYN